MSLVWCTVVHSANSKCAYIDVLVGPSLIQLAVYVLTPAESEKFPTSCPCLEPFELVHSADTNIEIAATHTRVVLAEAVT